MKRLVLALSAMLAAGSALGAESTTGLAECAACHGLDGIAKDAEVPHLAGQNELYLYNQMLAFRAGKRPHREMRHMARTLSNEEMAAIAAYYAALPPR